MSERVIEMFRRMDEDVRDRMLPEPADKEETMMLMLGLCQRAALMALSGVGREGMADEAAKQMVRLLLDIRNEGLQ
jgi:hypothetical protein